MKYIKYIIWKIQQVFKPLPITNINHFKINKNKKTLVLNGAEYELIDDVWGFLLQITTEMEFYKQKYVETHGENTQILS